jgi:hypothetical protein
MELTQPLLITALSAPEQAMADFVQWLSALADQIRSGCFSETSHGN